MNIDEQADPSESYVAPAREFRGVPLKPYSDGNKMLLAMITREGDPNAFFLFALLYVLTQPRDVVQKATANKDAARLGVLGWLDGLNLTHATEPEFKDEKPNSAYAPGEFEQAQELIVQVLQEANKNKVDPIAAASSGNA